MEETHMKFLLILFCIITLSSYFFGHVTYNNMEAHGMTRVVIALAGGLIFALIIGIPLLGVFALLGF